MIVVSVPLKCNRDFVLLWSGQALSSLGSQISGVAYPLLALALTGSPAKAGIVGFANRLPSAALALPAGVLADRFNRKHLMVACDGVRALAMVSLALGISLGTAPFALLVAVAFIDGGGWIVTFAAERGAMRQIVPPDQLSEAAARNESRIFAALLAGPPLGGLLFGIGRAIPFLADAISYAASTITKVLIKTDLQEARGDSAPGDIWDGLRWIWQRPFFRAVALMWMASTPVLTGAELLLVVIAKQHHASSTQIGVMLGIWAAGGLLGALLAPTLQRRCSPRLVLVGEEWMFALAFPFLLFVHNAVLIGCIFAVATLVMPVSNSIIVTYRVALAPDHLQGRVNASSAMISMSAAWLGPLAVGFLIETAGVTPTILIVTGWMVVLAGAMTGSRAFRRPPTLDTTVPTASAAAR
jgi:MFS family permease